MTLASTFRESLGVEVFRGHVLDALGELANEAVQRRLWFAPGGDGEEVSSLTECRCRLYDDSGLGAALDRGRVVFTAAIDDDLRSLESVLRRIDGQRPPASIAGDPNMTLVREGAAAILKSLRASTELPD